MRHSKKNKKEIAKLFLFFYVWCIIIIVYYGFSMQLKSVLLFYTEVIYDR